MTASQSGLSYDCSFVDFQAIGAELDLSDKGLGIRSRRFALLADDGVVRFLLPDRPL